MPLSDRIEQNETRPLTVRKYFHDTKVTAVQITVKIDGENEMAVVVSTYLWGDIEDNRNWMVYLLDGKLAMCTIQHNYNPSVQAYQLALDTMSEDFGGVRKYLIDFSDEHHWLDMNGNSAELREDDGESALFHYICSEGVRTVTPKGILAEYEIHPDHYDIILLATATGDVPSP